MEAIEAEVHKLIACGFIREVQHSDWVANIVPVLKKNGKIRICIDYRDLNTACPKDEFNAYHRRHDRKHMWIRNDVFHRRLFSVQSD